jgi:hypothetical protein
MNSVIQILKEENIIDKKGPNISNIDSLSIKDIVDISTEITENTRINHKPIKNPLFSHTASMSLGGGSIECCYVGCRIERIRKLARFAIMYSDKVFVDNFFAAYTDLDPKEDLVTVKQDFIEDLMVINEISPLLEKGVVDLFTPPKDICFSCQAKMFIGDDAANNFEQSYRKLKSDFLRDMSVEAKGGPEGLHFTCIGDISLFQS